MSDQLCTKGGKGSHATWFQSTCQPHIDPDLLHFTWVILNCWKFSERTLLQHILCWGCSYARELLPSLPPLALLPTSSVCFLLLLQGHLRHHASWEVIPESQGCVHCHSSASTVLPPSRSCPLPSCTHHSSMMAYFLVWAWIHFGILLKSFQEATTN